MKIPSYVAKQSNLLIRGWVSIYKHFFDSYGNDAAIIAANEWLKKFLQKQVILAKSKKIRRLEFSLEKGDDGFIKKSLDGDDYVSFMLADNLYDLQGDAYNPKLLKKWADQINSGKMLVGDIDHKEYDYIMATTASAEEIAKKLKSKQGIAKAVKAIYEKGKLWIKAVIDKRYKNVINKSQGVSLEAYVSDWDNNVATDGEIFGFSFMVDEPQANPRAVVTV